MSLPAQDMQGIGFLIRSRFPQHSPIHETGNPMRELIEEGIGPEFDSIKEDIFQGSDERFLVNSTGNKLDLWGSWFGVPRLGKTDDEYRANILALRAANPTIKGLKVVISAILSIEEDQVIIIDGAGLCCRVGSTAASHLSGTPCTFASHISTAPGIVTIKIPEGSGIEILESVINNLVLASVTVVLQEYVVE